MAGVGSSLDLLIDGYKKILEVGTEAQSFIKDDLPSNASTGSKWGQEVLRRTCRRFARANIPGIGVVNSPIWGEVCNPYLNSINEGPTTEGQYAPPFTGGQCSNVFYVGYANFRVQTGVVNGVRQYAYNSTKQQATTPIRGPISPISLPDVIGGVSSPCTSNQIIKRLAVSSPTTSSYVWADRAINFTYNDAPACQSAPWSAINLEFRRQDNQADTCGNPPTQYTPPSYPTNLPTLPPPTNPAPGLGNGWDVTINPDGTFKICIGSECTPNINPDGSSPDPREEPGSPDGPPQSNDPNDPQDEIAGCVTSGNVLVGLKINITTVPTGEVKGSGGLYRKVCWVWMGPSENQLDLVADGKYLESGQFIIPDSDNCRCYRVKPSPLWGVSVQPYSRPEKTTW